MLWVTPITVGVGNKENPFPAMRGADRGRGKHFPLRIIPDRGQIDPNEVKVVTDLNGDALYFSREPIPSRRKGTPHVPMHKQVCIIPFRRDYLLKFNAMDECPLEIIESVDMMRILEHGEKVRMVPTDKRTLSVDTQEDLERVREMMRDDALRISYTK